MLTDLSRVEHFILKQVIDRDNSKASQRTKSLARFLNVCVCVYVCACMHAQLCLTFCDPWTITHQAPLSLEFSRQEYWSWLVLPTPVHLPHPKIKPTSPVSPVSLPLSHQQGLFSSSFLTQAAPVKYKTQSKPSGNAVERMNNVINMWMKLYSINWLLIIPCLRL